MLSIVYLEFVWVLLVVEFLILLILALVHLLIGVCVVLILFSLRSRICFTTCFSCCLTFSWYPKIIPLYLFVFVFLVLLHLDVFVFFCVLVFISIHLFLVVIAVLFLLFLVITFSCWSRICCNSSFCFNLRISILSSFLK